MNRIDRLMAILILLQTKKIIRADDIAVRFEISKRTVYRDIRSLEEAGVPIGAESGLGYFLMEGYHLPPVMFTKNEAGALLTAEKLIEKLTDNSTKNIFKGALDKIKSILPDKEKGHIEKLSSFIHILSYPSETPDELTENCFSDLQQALVDKTVVKINYHAAYSGKNSENRLIEPVGLCYYGFAWHLIAYCRLRSDYRDFRLSRIKNIELTTDCFDGKGHKTFKEYLNSLFKTENMEPVIIRFDTAISEFIEKSKYYYGYIDENRNEKFIEMYFMTDSLDFIARWVLTCGNKAEVVKPVELKEMVKGIVQELSVHYKV